MLVSTESPSSLVIPLKQWRDQIKRMHHGHPVHMKQYPAQHCLGAISWLRTNGSHSLKSFQGRLGGLVS